MIRSNVWALHLLRLHLRLLNRAVAGVGGPTAGADLQTSSGKEAAKVNPFKVFRQTVHPWWHIRKDIYCMIPAGSVATLSWTFNCASF